MSPQGLAGCDIATQLLKNGVRYKANHVATEFTCLRALLDIVQERTRRGEQSRRLALTLSVTSTEAAEARAARSTACGVGGRKTMKRSRCKRGRRLNVHGRRVCSAPDVWGHVGVQNFGDEESRAVAGRAPLAEERVVILQDHSTHVEVEHV